MFNPQTQDPSSMIQRSQKCQQDSSESSDSSSSDDSDENWKKSKRGKKKEKKSLKSTLKALKTPTNTIASSSGLPDTNKQNQTQRNDLIKKRNNIWTNVLQEQSLTEDIHTLDVLRTDSDTRVNRQCESYRYVVNQDDKRDQLLRMGRKRDVQDMRDGNRRALVKERLGLKMDDEDTDEMAVTAIASVLREPKMDLISKVVEVLGKEKALCYMAETQDIEAAGGKLTYDRQRRRTPGGVYFNLVKTDPQVTEDEKQRIFEEDKKRFEYVKRRLRAAERELKIQKKKALLAQEEKNTDKPLPMLTDLVLQGINANNSQPKTTQMDCEREPGEVSDSDAEEVNDPSTVVIPS